eukprot:2525174-Pyramimonas_sp.AAC.1
MRAVPPPVLWAAAPAEASRSASLGLPDRGLSRWGRRIAPHRRCIAGVADTSAMHLRCIGDV